MYQYPDYLYHHGVKGMKWGVRKQKRESYKIKTKYGEDLTLKRRKTPVIGRIASRVSPHYRSEINK